jgi:hypothetical protein
MIPVAVTPAVMRNPEYALDRAHGATNSGPDRPTDDSTYRPGDAIAFIGTFLRPAHDSLSVADMGNSQQRQCGGRKRQSKRPVRRRHNSCLNLGSFHLNSFIRHRLAGKWDCKTPARPNGCTV